MAKVCRRSGKVNHRSETAALAALARAATSNTAQRRHVKTEIDYYKCPVCPYWHLTSMPQSRRAEPPILDAEPSSSPDVEGTR